MKKIYSAGQIRFTGFFGGPLVAAYLLVENFKVFGEKEKVTQTWLAGSLVMLVLIVLNVLHPGMSRTIPFTLPMLTFLAINSYTRAFQDKRIKEQINNGTEVYPWGHAIGVILLGVFISLAIIVPLAFALQRILPNLDIARH